jgi:hypothetical protein
MFILILEGMKDSLNGVNAETVDADAYRSKTWRHVGSDGDVIEAGKSDVFRHLKAGIPKSTQGANGH